MKIGAVFLLFKFREKSNLRETMCNIATVLFLCLALSNKAIGGQTEPSDSASNDSSSHLDTSTSKSTCGAGSTQCPSENSSITREPLSLTNTTIESTSATGVPPENATEGSSSVSTPKQRNSSFTSSPSSSTSPLPLLPPPPTISPSTYKVNQDQVTGFSPSGTCSCDLMAHFCDINCCCDPDCSAQKRASFSECLTTGYSAYENQYCSASKLIFLNNSEYILQQTHNSAFCIVRSNLAGSILYPSRSALTTQQEFNKQWALSHSPIWPNVSPSTLPQIEKPHPYLAGAPLLILKKNHIETFSLPSSGLTSACSVLKEVQYLNPWSTHCVRKAPTTSMECEQVTSSMYQQIKSLIRSPLHMNMSQLLVGKNVSCSSNVCAVASFFECPDSVSLDHNVNLCKKMTNKNSFLGYKSGGCFGAIKKLKLNFYHNGTEGLSHLEAFMLLSNVTNSETQKSTSFHQTISVEFFWTNSNSVEKEVSDNSTQSLAQNVTSKRHLVPFPRSGNPGYIVGKPVLAGVKVRQRHNLNDSKDSLPESKSSKMEQDFVEMSRDPRHWLTVPVSNFDGKCDWSGSERHIVTFGEDLHTSCGIVLSRSNVSSYSSCYSLRGRMLQLLLGNVTNALHNSSLSSGWGRVLGAFGNANVSNPQDWVPFLLDEQSSSQLVMNSISSGDSNAMSTGDEANHPVAVCENVPLGLAIHIMHGLIGPTTNPQSKILGASLRFSTLQDIGWMCPSPFCFQDREEMSLRIVSAVKFVDVSSPAVTKFADPPAIHIRLPPDFFYPFMSESSSSKASLLVSSFNHMKYLSLCLLMFLLLTNSV